MNILDRMRLGQTTAEDIALLNRNIDPNKTTGDFAVALTSTNRRADFINDTRLAEIDSEEFSYEGTLEGKFRIQDSPVPEILRLKKGAQVIFCRNDFARGVVNCTIGQVSELGDDTIKVTLKNGNELDVERTTWKTEKRVYDEAAEVDALIVKASHETETRSPIDSKQYLFEMRLNQALRRSNIETCKHLLSRCPEYLPAYSVIRDEALDKGIVIETHDDEAENALIAAFNNKEMSATDFEKMLRNYPLSSIEFKNFSRKANKIKQKDSIINHTTKIGEDKSSSNHPKSLEMFALNIS